MEEFKMPVNASEVNRNLKYLIRKVDILGEHLACISESLKNSVEIEKENPAMTEKEILRRQLELLAVDSEQHSGIELGRLSEAMIGIVNCLSAIEQAEGQGAKEPVEMKEFVSMDEFAKFIAKEIASREMDSIMKRHSPFN